MEKPKPSEPDPTAIFSRRLFREFPVYLSLEEIRVEIDAIEPQLVGVLAEHRSAIDVSATVAEASMLPLVRVADMRLVQLDRLQTIARRLNPGLEGFEDLVEEMHRAMVSTDEVEAYDACWSEERELRLVTLLAGRCRLVRQAAFFKRNLDESSAPDRQVRNITNARGLASASQYEGLAGFEDYVAKVYGALVPGSVELQHRFWRSTQSAAPRHQAIGGRALAAARGSVGGGAVSADGTRGSLVA